jgi:GNAT superfamily N-acetyltransferase
MPHVRIVPASESDVPVILEMIRGLAEYEKLAHTMTATEEQLRQTLFGPRPAAEVLLAYGEGAEDASGCAGFALFFMNYSTFLARPGMWLEDLFVKPQWRGKGIGLALLRRLGEIARERECGRLEWAVLDWNTPSIDFYKKLGAMPMDDWTIFRLTGAELERLGTADQYNSSGAISPKSTSTPNSRRSQEVGPSARSSSKSTRTLPGSSDSSSPE